MQPDSPQLGPHEFLIFQFPPTIPTSSTAWLMDVAQLLKTPDQYRDQLVASTATANGWILIPDVKELQAAEMQLIPLILNVPPFFRHFCCLATYGQLLYAVIPLATTYFNADAGQPPLHPWFPQLVEQSINCCSERSQVVLVFISAQDSEVAVAANAQHDPHCPWFFTLVTPRLVVQSISALGTSCTQSLVSISCSSLGIIIYDKNLALNYSSEKIVNWLIPILQV